MKSINDILSPLKTYNQAKEFNNENAEEFFNDLIKQSNTNVEANKSTCESYYAKLQEVENAEKLNNKVKKKKGFLKFLMIVCFILIVLIPVGILIRNKIKNSVDVAIKENEEKINKLKSEGENLKNEAINQTAVFNAMLDWNISANLFSKTIPLIEMDRYFNSERFEYLHEKYGYLEHNENNISTIFVQSGSILGNPFVIEKNFVEEMGMHTYTGTLVIHWVTYTHDKDGTHAHHHTQTLVAHVVKPAPYYYYDTWLIYGNESAPKLSFSRTPSKANTMNDKQIDKMVKSFDKKLDKKVKKDINFTKMGNSKFETLFNATDRDNEVEFRLLFTPLAQENLIDLITSKDTFGDDFYFIKRNCLNYIKTGHSQSFDYSSSPDIFNDFDISRAHEKFINYNNEFFTNLYFDFAPLISIPLYQNHKDNNFIFKENHLASPTKFEVESLANCFDKEEFRPESSATDIILKSNLVNKSESGDIYDIDAYSFEKIPHVDMVPTLGGDGHMHAVPVTWFEYLPVKSTNSIVVKPVKENRYDFNKNNTNIFTNLSANNIYYQKGLVAGLLNKNK